MPLPTAPLLALPLALEPLSAPVPPTPPPLEPVPAARPLLPPLEPLDPLRSPEPLPLVEPPSTISVPPPLPRVPTPSGGPGGGLLPQAHAIVTRTTGSAIVRRRPIAIGFCTSSYHRVQRFSDTPVTRRRQDVTDAIRSGGKAPAMTMRRGCSRRRYAASVAAALFAGAACGGTSGHEDLPSAAAPVQDATIDGPGDDDGGADATSIYTAEFDVLIPYSDVALPEASTSAAVGGGEAGSASTSAGAIPNCPPFIPVQYVQSADGGAPSVQVVSALGPGIAFDDELPADWAADGGVTFAADGSACATYPWWLGTSAADECLTNYNGIASSFIVPVLPPCSWAFDAGAPTQGTGATSNKTRYEVCMDLYTCMIATGCYTRFLQADQFGPNEGPLANNECFCGHADGSAIPLDQADCVAAPLGPCRAQFMAAFELQDVPANYVKLLMEDGKALVNVPGALTGLGWPAKALTAEVKTMMNEEGTAAISPSPICPDPISLGISPPLDASVE